MKPNKDYNPSLFPSRPLSTNPYIQQEYERIIGNMSKGLAYAEGSQNSVGSFAEILAKFKELYGSNDMAWLINGFGFSPLYELLNGSAGKDWNKQLLETLLQQYLTEENRAYNESRTAEQRIFDDPLNQLARLTGAGVGRDAAIAMLQGGQQPVTSDSSTVAPGLAPSESRANAIGAATSVVNTLFGAMSTVGSLASFGLSIPQAIEQTKFLRGQNLMSNETLQGLEAVNQVGSAIAGLVSSGVLSTADLDSFTNGSDMLSYINDHRDTDAFKPLFTPGGAMQTLLGTKSGRQMFDNYWNSTINPKHSGDMLESFLNQAKLQESLSYIDTLAKRQQMFTDFNSFWIDFMNQNADLAQKYQDYQNGAIQIAINGEILKQERLNTSAAERQDYVANTQYIAYQNFIERGFSPSVDPLQNDGQDYLNYITWSKYCDDLLKAEAKTGTNRVDSPDGKSAMDRTKDLYIKNPQVLYTGLVLQEAMQKGRLNSYNGSLQPVWQFFDMWSATGATNFVGDVQNGAQDVTETILGRKMPLKVRK